MEMKIARWAAALCVSAAFMACDDDPVSPQLPARYQVEVSGETFVVQVGDEDQARELEDRLTSGAEGVLSGELAPGDGGFNAPWSWHMAPATVHAPDVAIEVCDGRPSMVEEDLAYWFNTVERFCPWGATVVSRLD